MKKIKNKKEEVPNVKQVNAADLTIQELKSFKCDHYEAIQRSQTMIQAINAELDRRSKKKKEV